MMFKILNVMNMFKVVFKNALVGVVELINKLSPVAFTTSELIY